MKKLFAVILILASAYTVDARIVLSGLIADNMVLQQNSEVALWGTCEPRAEVAVTPSWNGSTVTVKSDQNGEWKVYVKTPRAGGPYSITFSDGEEIVIDNVLIGEVWLCMGQSNMVMPMKGFTAQPVEGAMEYIVGAKPSCPIRICNVKRATKLQASSVCKASWQTHTPDAVAGASATAYFFAKKLQETLDVPVGVIVSSWGGSTIQAWMSKEVLASHFPTEVDLSFLNRNEKPENPHQAPTMLYNGMLAPLKNYGIKGVIWYQGCANKGEAELYSRLQPEFVKMLRRMWCNNELPFYYAQIAGFQYTGSQNLEAALIREAQLENSKIIPFSGMIVSMDCSDETCIHPGKKKPVGDRFAYLALQKTYGMSGFDAVSPLYESHEIKGNVVYVKFTKTMWGGVGHKGKSLVGFELAGEDRKFYPAEACNHSKDSHVIEVKSDMVPVPVAVRYAFRNYAPVSIYNTFGIPASPFRTDDWDE